MVARRPVGHDAAFRADVETPVPAFIRRFGMFVFVPLLQDIIVGFNSTLVIHESIHHLIARNIWCYEGSAIRQKSGYLSVDAELLRGGISRIFHAIDRDRLVIDKRVLSELATIMN